MLRSEYRYCALSAEQYQAIISGGSGGNVSPMLGGTNYQDFMAASQGIDCDARVLLSGIQFESHYGCDVPALSEVCNLSGIIYAQQSYAYKSDVLRPLNERPNDPQGTRDSSHYAGFYNLGDYYREFARTMTNVFIGPYFNTGDLVTAWGVYVGGPSNPNMAAGQARVAQWEYTVAKWPPDATVAPPPSGGNGGEVDVMVNASAVVAMAQSQIGHANSGGYDSNNGSHPWAYWCQAMVESTHRQLGLSVTPQRSALVAAAAYDLRQGSPPLGAAVYFGTQFYFPDGHVGISMGDGRLLGTLTDGTGVGYRWWNESTNGFLGWAYYAGVVPLGEAVDPPPVASLVPENNPYNPAADGREVGLGGGFLRMWNAIALGGEPLTILGFPVSNEETAKITDADGSSRVRTIQRFERGTLVYEPLALFPWDVTFALTSQTFSSP